MISQKGCISEKLMRARERGEFNSYSEWATEAAALSKAGVSTEPT
jgi:hypothetical protein